MSSLNISIDGLAEIQKVLEQHPSLATMQADLSIGILQIHNLLADKISQQYFVPYPLDDVFQGIATQQAGDSSLSFGLSYRNKKVPLADYPHSAPQELEVRNAIPFKRHKKDGSTSTGYIPVNKAYSIRSTIRRRGGGGNTTLQRKKYKKFLTVVNGREMILARKQEETWLELPELDVAKQLIPGSGTRAPTEELLGPRLSDLADNIFNSSSEFDSLASKIIDKAIEGFKGFYA